MNIDFNEVLRRALTEVLVKAKDEQELRVMNDFLQHVTRLDQKVVDLGNQILELQSEIQRMKDDSPGEQRLRELIDEQLPNFEELIDERLPDFGELIENSMPDFEELIDGRLPDFDELLESKIDGFVEEVLDNRIGKIRLVLTTD